MTGDETTGRQATAVVRELVRSKLLDATRGTADRPHWVRPTPLALRMLGGWPADGAQELLSGLVEALNTEIDRTPDRGRRSVLVQVCGYIMLFDSEKFHRGDAKILAFRDEDG
jgi:hypothetical protein